MSKYDYEIEKYVVHYGELENRKKRAFDEEKNAVEFARSVETENPCIYKIERMIMDDIKA